MERGDYVHSGSKTARVVGAVSCPRQKREKREDKSGPGNLHNGLAEEARSPGSCTSTRAVGCSLRGSTQILQLKVKRCVQREDGSSLGSLHDALAREARGPGSRTSTRITHFAPDEIQRVATKRFPTTTLSLTFLFSFCTFSCSFLQRILCGWLVPEALTRN